jgi:large subunit ribosomal protein L17
MRHGKHGRKFSRQSGPRHALFSNLVSSLIEHERIKTTDAKAKELRRIAEKTISWATSVGHVVEVEDDKKSAEDRARIVHAMRMAQRVLKHKPTLHKLFSEIGPRLVGRAGGYTRVLKVGYRHGDAAPLSIIELVDRDEVLAAQKAEEEAAAAAAGGGKKKKAETTAEAAPPAAQGKAKASKKKAEEDQTAEEKPKKKAKKKTEE